MSDADRDADGCKKEETMRAILIDPKERTVTEVELQHADDEELELDELYKVLHCQRIASGAHLGGTIEKGFDHLLISDDPIDERDQLLLTLDGRECFWFQVDIDREPPMSYQLAGRGLAVGVDRQGGRCDVRISVHDLARRVTFFTAFNPLSGSGHKR
jgi:hypothetical protein